MQSVASMIASCVRRRLFFGQISTQMLQRLHHSSTQRMLTKSTIVGARCVLFSAAYTVVMAESPELGRRCVDPQPAKSTELDDRPQIEVYCGPLGAPLPALGDLLNLQDRLGAGPMALQLVVVAFRRCEDVDDYGAKVQQRPMRVGATFPADRPDAFGAELVHDAVTDGAELALGTAGADDEVIRHSSQLGDLQKDYVRSLL